MKFNQALYRTFLAKPNPKIKAILVYGPDDGAVHEEAADRGADHGGHGQAADSAGHRPLQRGADPDGPGEAAAVPGDFL